MEKHNGSDYPNLKSFAFNYVYKARIYLYYYLHRPTGRPAALTSALPPIAVVAAAFWASGDYPERIQPPSNMNEMQTPGLLQ